MSTLSSTVEKIKKTTKKPTKKTVRKAPKKKKSEVMIDYVVLVKNLRTTGFEGGISMDGKLLDAYSTDESIFSIRPQLVLQPKNAHDVELAVSVVAAMSDARGSVSLTPRAAGTGLGGGSLTDQIVIDVCAHMHQIGSIHKEVGYVTVTCEPGAMCKQVEKKLARYGMYLPSLPASKDMCSMGGIVGNNAAGADTLRYGHTAEHIERLDVVLHDGLTYTISPLSYEQLEHLMDMDHAYATIARDVFKMIKTHEKTISNNEPKTAKNSAGYALWDVISTDVKSFMAGNGVFDLTRLIAGSQGTLGIVTRITMRAIPVQKNTTTLLLPIFDLEHAAEVITNVLQYDPVNVEFFDALTLKLALQNPSFLTSARTKLSLLSLYNITWKRNVPAFTVLVTLDREAIKQHGIRTIKQSVSVGGVSPRILKNKTEKDMLWQVRRASYTLSKAQDPNRRPAAFLEDMTVPPENLSAFFAEVQELLEKFGTPAAVHGHGGNGHFHFYPLLDFTDKNTPKLVQKMSDAFFNTAVKYGGNICGEHNDGIIRTPHLDKMFSKRMLTLFKKVEAVFDPQDVFNPGKKVNPRFDVTAVMRTEN